MTSCPKSAAAHGQRQRTRVNTLPSGVPDTKTTLGKADEFSLHQRHEVPMTCRPDLSLAFDQAENRMHDQSHPVALSED